MQKFFFLALIIALPLAYFLYVYEGDFTLDSWTTSSENPTVRIGNTPVRVEIADTLEERAIGLSGRDEIGPTAGMLFIFDESDYHRIWMKDMRISIDVIWIDENLTVVDITENLRTDTYPRLFEPATPVRFIIETNNNYVSTFGIKVGDMVSIPKEHIPEDLRN